MRSVPAVRSSRLAVPLMVAAACLTTPRFSGDCEVLAAPPAGPGSSVSAPGAASPSGGPAADGSARDAGASAQVLADARWSWDPFGPVGNTDGLTAIAVDPDDPRVYWLAGTSSVWVTDDGGDTWSLVLHLSRSAGSSRASNPLEDDEDVARDFDGNEPGDFDSESSGSEYGVVEDFEPDEAPLEGEGVDGEGVAVAPDDTEGDLDTVNADETPEDLSEDRQAAFSRTSFGVSRLRVSGDTLWVCTSRGLWGLPRSARSLGQATELRLGRRLGVNDALVYDADRVLVASDAGLWIHSRGLGRRVRGLEYDAVVTALVRVGDQVLAATSLGLYGGHPDDELFARLGAGGRGEGGLVDLVLGASDSDGGRQLFAADGSRVYRYGLDGQAIGDAWPVPGASRLAVAPDGALWAAGPRGPWRWDEESGWARFDETLSDRRLRDLAVGPIIATQKIGPAPKASGRKPGPAAAPSSGQVAPGAAAPAARDLGVRVVGVAGAWRLIEGRTVLTPAQRLERRMDAAITARGDVATLLGHADAQRVLTLGAVDRFGTREQLAWLLPLVELRFMSTVQRDERATLFPSVGVRLTDMVEVAPQGDFFQLMAWWDLMPAVLTSLDASSARVYENARFIARRNLRRVREALPPLWRDWVARQKALWQADPPTTREALRALLGVAQLEAQLHALTLGRFPVSDSLSDYLHPRQDATP